MKCERVVTSDLMGHKHTAFICGSRKREAVGKCKCGKDGTRLCDFPIRDHNRRANRTITRRCDRPMCEDCASSVGTNLDFCPDHRGQRPQL
jgi:hypothetical protein